MNERNTWTQTVEWLHMECETVLMKRPMILPAEELSALAKVGIRRLTGLVDVCRERSLYNQPHARLLMFVWLHLCDDQKTFLRNEPGGKVFEEAERLLGYHPALREVMLRDKHKYWSTESYVTMIHKVTPKSIIKLPDETVKEIMSGYFSDPLYARCNDLAIQWTGDNLEDIERYIGSAARLESNGIERLVFKHKQTNWQITREQWVWFDEQGTLVVGDVRKMLEARYKSPNRVPGAWFKPTKKETYVYSSNLCPEVQL